MKYLLNLLFFALLLSSCGNKTTEGDETTPTKDSAATPGTKTTTPAAPSAKDGIQKETYADGQTKMEGEIKNGTRFGMWTAYYPDGTKQSECYYEDGKKNGKTATYYKTGRIRYIGYYNWDKPSGTWEFYDEEGKLADKKEYK